MGFQKGSVSFEGKNMRAFRDYGSDFRIGKYWVRASMAASSVFDGSLFSMQNSCDWVHGRHQECSPSNLGPMYGSVGACKGDHTCKAFHAQLLWQERSYIHVWTESNPLDRRGQAFMKEGYGFSEL